MADPTPSMTPPIPGQHPVQNNTHAGWPSPGKLLGQARDHLYSGSNTPTTQPPAYNPSNVFGSDAPKENYGELYAQRLKEQGPSTTTQSPAYNPSNVFGSDAPKENYGELYAQRLKEQGPSVDAPWSPPNVAGPSSLTPPWLSPPKSTTYNYSDSDTAKAIQQNLQHLTNPLTENKPTEQAQSLPWINSIGNAFSANRDYTNNSGTSGAREVWNGINNHTAGIPGMVTNALGAAIEPAGPAINTPLTERVGLGNPKVNLGDWINRQSDGSFYKTVSPELGNLLNFDTSPGSVAIWAKPVRAATAATGGRLIGKVPPAVPGAAPVIPGASVPGALGDSAGIFGRGAPKVPRNPVFETPAEEAARMAKETPQASGIAGAADAAKTTTPGWTNPFANSGGVGRGLGAADTATTAETASKSVPTRTPTGSPGSAGYADAVKAYTKPLRGLVDKAVNPGLGWRTAESLTGFGTLTNIPRAFAHLSQGAIGSGIRDALYAGGAMGVPSLIASMGPDYTKVETTQERDARLKSNPNALAMNLRGPSDVNQDPLSYTMTKLLHPANATIGSFQDSWGGNKGRPTIEGSIKEVGNNAYDIAKQVWHNPSRFLDKVQTSVENVGPELTKRHSQYQEQYNKATEDYANTIRRIQNLPIEERNQAQAEALRQFKEKVIPIEQGMASLNKPINDQESYKQYLLQQDAIKLIQNDPKYKGRGDEIADLAKRMYPSQYGDNRYLPNVNQFGYYNPNTNQMPFPTARTLSEANALLGREYIPPGSNQSINAPVNLTDEQQKGYETQNKQYQDGIRNRLDNLRPTSNVTAPGAGNEGSFPPTALNIQGSQPTTPTIPGQSNLTEQPPKPNPWTNGDPKNVSGSVIPPEKTDLSTDPTAPKTAPTPEGTPPPKTEVAHNIAGLVGMSGGTIPGALEAMKQAPPPQGFEGYWNHLDNSSKMLVMGGLSLAAVMTLKRMFGSDDDEESFLEKVLPLLGVGAAAWGAGGGFAKGDISAMPTMANYQRLGDAFSSNAQDLYNRVKSNSVKRSIDLWV